MERILFTYSWVAYISMHQYQVWITIGFLKEHVAGVSDCFQIDFFLDWDSSRGVFWLKLSFFLISFSSECSTLFRCLCSSIVFLWEVFGLLFFLFDFSFSKVMDFIFFPEHPSSFFVCLLSFSSNSEVSVMSEGSSKVREEMGSSI